MAHAVTVLAVSERRVCWVVAQCRATQQYVPNRPDDEEVLRARIVVLARDYGRYGYRRMTALVQQEGWRVNHKCVERIWRQEGLKVPQKQPQRTRLWLADGACMRRRPEYANHVWTSDVVMERTQDGQPLKLLTVVDEYTRECLAMAVRRQMRATEVQKVLGQLFLTHGCPTHIRSDNGPEFIATAPCGRGIDSWESPPCSLSRAVPGRTALWSPLTESCETSY